MPRIARIIPKEGIFHILTRGNNRQKVFKDDADYKQYLYLLKSYKAEHNFFLYHYCLMPNHTHLILETTSKTNLSQFMKRLNLSYMYHYRRRYAYSGHFWQDRYKSLLIDKDEYLIACGRYIEVNPVRANMVKDPKDYSYSSYNVYAYGQQDNLVDIDPLYQDLGKTNKERQEEYRKSLLEEIKISLNARFLGSSSFIKNMEEKFKVKNLQDRKGRPKRENN